MKITKLELTLIYICLIIISILTAYNGDRISKLEILNNRKVEFKTEYLDCLQVADKGWDVNECIIKYRD